MKQGKSMHDKLTPIGKIIYMVRVARFYHNGDGAGFIWRWWHPLSWILAPIGFIVACVIVGVPEAWRNRHEFGFCMDPWFVRNPDKLEWA